MAEPVLPVRLYFAIFAVLMLLTGLTIAVATLDLGRLNTIVALTIAVVKATLVLLYFMHLRYSTPLTWLVTGGALVWLGIMIGLTLSDELTRHWLRTLSQ